MANFNNEYDNEFNEDENNIKNKCDDIKEQAVLLANSLLRKHNEQILNNIIDYFRKQAIIFTYTQNRLEDTISEKLKNLLDNSSSLEDEREDVRYRNLNKKEKEAPPYININFKKDFSSFRKEGDY